MAPPFRSFHRNLRRSGLRGLVIWKWLPLSGHSTGILGGAGSEDWSSGNGSSFPVISFAESTISAGILGGAGSGDWSSGYGSPPFRSFRRNLRRSG
ncbi:MAG: hypothetical protein K1X92_13175 [Bacteroidia bacterium]|nr:hypothetical protein [Bacteroidia bacterium]